MNQSDYDLLRVLFIPDCHHPYASKKAWGLLLQVAAAFKPDKVIIGGDFADCISVSGHERLSARARFERLSEELVGVNKALDQLQNAADEASEIVYLEGNHEDRLTRYLAKNAAAIADDENTIPKRLRLQERGIAWKPYRTSYKLGKLHLTHDLGRAGMNAHRNAEKKFGGSNVTFHTHRMAYEVTGRFEGPPVLSAMFGWLGDPESVAVEYMHEVNAKSDWVHGFGIGYMEKNGIVHCQPIPIINGRCCALGRVFS